MPPKDPRSIIDAAVSKLPGSVKPAAEALAPALGAGANLLIALLPYLEMLWNAIYQGYLVVQPYEGLQTAIIGFVYLFFGGSFMTTIAAWEAFKMCGYNETKRHVLTLYDSYQVAKAASHKDDEKDDDGDGIADVRQINPAMLVQRKAMLMLKVLDPDVVSEAAAGAWGGFMGVVAVLKVRFARAVTLGAAIGDTAYAASKATVLPALTEACPAEYQKWVGPVLNYLIKFVAVSIAWFIQRIISSIHTSTRGAEMLLTGVCAFCKQKDIALPAAFDPEGSTFRVISTVLAVVGFLWQLWNGFGIMFPLNLLLLPATIFENVLMMFVAE